MRNKLKNLLKDTAWFALGNFGSKIIAFLLVPLYTNILTTKEYGIIDLFTTTISILIPVFTLSLQDGAFRFALDKDENQKGVFSVTFSFTLVSVLFIIPFIPLLCIIIPDFSDYVLYFILLYLFTALTGVISYFAKGIGKNSLFALNGIISSVSISALNIIFLVWFKKGIYGYLLGMILSGVISVFFLLFIGKLIKYYSIKNVDFDQLKKIIKYSIPLIPATIAWLVMVSVDKYMLLYMEGVEANGLYGVAHKIPSLSSTVMALFINAWQIAAVKGKDDKDTDEFTSSIFNVLYIIGFFMTYAVVILSEPFARILFAKDFYNAWVLTPCLTVATTLSVFSNFIGGIFTAHKRSDLHFKSNTIALAFNIVLNYVLITIIDFRGVSIATMVSFCIVFIYRNIKVKSLATISYSRIKLYLGIVVLMFSAIITTFEVKCYYIIGAVGFCLSILLYKNEILDIIHNIAHVVKTRKGKRKEI